MFVRPEAEVVLFAEELFTAKSPESPEPDQTSPIELPDV